MLKADYLVKAIRQHKMDQAIIFCRTKLDCDNIENYLLTLGGGLSFIKFSYLTCSGLHTLKVVAPSEFKLFPVELQ